MCKYCEPVIDGIFTEPLISGSCSCYSTEVYIFKDKLKSREYDGEDEIKINYCPMCGRNLKEKE